MKKILIIEDDPIIGKLYHAQFEKAGFQVELAADGQEGFYRVQEGRFDGILLDLMLPNMSGLDILRKIRAQKTFQRLVVVVFTNSFLSEMFDAANEAGANRIFHKSNLTPKDLIEVVNQELFLAKKADDGSGGDGDAGEDSRPGRPSSTTYRQELIETFLKRAPDAIAALENANNEFAEASGKAESANRLQELYRKLHAFSGVAGLAGLKRLGELCSSLEALLVEMHENVGANTMSTRRTVTRSIEFLKKQFPSLAALPETADQAARVLVVDDEAMARRAATFALDLGGFEVATHEDARASMELLSKRGFHLVVLDETMPGLTGSQMIARMRQGPPNQKTPAILVLGRAEFEARAGERLPTNLDFVSRPYPFAELAVKALVLLLAHQVVDIKPLKMVEGE
ncbi:MAG TPA: hypothetical protein DCY13_19270 [Verrucomicrobiales bacterium]|nr:hypothetical protein [Verrucomicrobiales bacterium]